MSISFLMDSHVHFKIQGLQKNEDWQNVWESIMAVFYLWGRLICLRMWWMVGRSGAQTQAQQQKPFEDFNLPKQEWRNGCITQQHTHTHFRASQTSDDAHMLDI
jgi:hypothetical protein